MMMMMMMMALIALYSAILRSRVDSLRFCRVLGRKGGGVAQ